MNYFFSIMFCAVFAIGQAQASPDGARLFSTNCAACHGEQGTGGIGVPLALASFQATITDEYVRKTIRLGRPGRVMPAFTQLSDEEVGAVVKYVRAWNKGPAVTYTERPVRGNPVRGKQLFARYCASCHGAAGDGGKGTGVTFSRPRDLPIMAPALHNPGFLASASDEMIKATLMQGRQGTPMISFIKAGLTERNINDIVHYVRDFEKQPLASSAKILAVEESIIVRQSPHDLKTTVENIKQAIGNNNFFSGRIQPLEYGFISPEQANPTQIIVYFCNISLLNEALMVDPRVGMFLPCRITITEHEGKVMVMSVNPKVLSRIFNNSELNVLCERMSQSYIAIMEEAIL